MKHLTPEQIANLCVDLYGSANRAAINKLFREQDESNLFPIRGRFSATNRAIKQAQKFNRDSGCDCAGLEYALLLDQLISDIVNGAI